MKKILIIFLFLLFGNSISNGQSKSETITWINNHGESYLGLLTGLYAPGTDLSVTDFGTLNLMVKDTQLILPSGDTSIQQNFSVHLSELDPNKIYIYHDDSGLGSLRSKNQIKIGCQLKNECISATHEFRYGDRKSFNTSHISIDIREGFDDKKAKRLRNALVHAVKLFGGKSKSIDEDLFDN